LGVIWCPAGLCVGQAFQPDDSSFSNGVRLESLTY
jgi:hypothetical protein